MLRTWAPRPDASPEGVLFPGEVLHINDTNPEQLQVECLIESVTVRKKNRKNPETPRGLNWLPTRLKSTRTSAAPLNSYAASLIRAENTLGSKRDSDTTHYRADERIVAAHNVSQKALWGIYPSVGSIHRHPSPAPNLPSESAC